MATSMVYKVNKHINAVCLQRTGTKSVSPEKQPLLLPVARTHTTEICATEIFVRTLRSGQYRYLLK